MHEAKNCPEGGWVAARSFSSHPPPGHARRPSTDRERVGLSRDVQTCTWRLNSAEAPTTRGHHVIIACLVNTLMRVIVRSIHKAMHMPILKNYETFQESNMFFNNLEFSWEKSVGHIGEK